MGGDRGTALMRVTIRRETTKTILKVLHSGGTKGKAVIYIPHRVFVWVFMLIAIGACIGKPTFVHITKG
jgi:hypothetical protein